MKTTQHLLATLKQTPADAEVTSHRLMLRAGLIRRVAAGVYSWLPLGMRVLHRVERIIRQEMNRAGAQEVLLPGVQPAELWQQSGRWNAYGPELLRFQDRHARDFCLGPTHEEVITTLVKNEVQSYRQLPINLYQIQTKFRDEIRPRFGVMRGREFIMKDAYSFDLDPAGLQQSYTQMYQAYCRIFTRLGLRYRAVIADNGSIGGEGSHEFHVLADSGEDAIAYSDTSDYAANLEMAAAPPPAPRGAAREDLRLVDTPHTKTIQALVDNHQLPIEKTIKTLIVQAAPASPHPLIALLVRGDHELNPVKAAKQPGVANPLRMAAAADIRAAIGAGPGSLGPVNLPIPCIVDHSVAALSDFGAGANIEDKHYFGINWQRDVELSRVADLRNVVSGDPSPDGHGHLRLARGIEVGHVFQLGTKYSEALNATVLNEAGQAVPLAMGCYGIGVTRVIAAAIEQHHDAKGIVWPPNLAPYDLAIVPIGYQRNRQVRATADRLHDKLEQKGYAILLDDRDERPGVLFADIDLLGIPHRLTLGTRSLAEGTIEYQHRASGKQEQISLKPLTKGMQRLQEIMVVSEQ